MKTKEIIILVLALISFSSSAQDSISLSLQEALDYAREHNYDKQMARLDIEIAKQKVKETIGIGLPQVSGTAGYTNNLKLPVQPFGDQLFTLGQKHNASAGIGLNQLIFDGSYIVGVQATKAYEKISELTTLKTDEALTEAVLQLYSSIIISKETLRIFKENLKVLEKNVNDVTEIYQVGLGEEQTVEQMTYNRNIMQNSILNTENNLKILYQNLAFILNVENDQPLKLTTQFEDIVNEYSNLVDEEELKDFSNHIDLKIAENQTITDKLQLKYEKSKYLPTLSGFFSSEYNGFSDTFDLFRQKYYNTSLWGLSLNVPIFSGLQRKAKVQQARNQLTIAELNQLKISKELEKNANEGFLNYQNALMQYDLALQQVALSESIYNKENIKFFEGLGTSLELTQAENQLFQAQTQLIQNVSELVTRKIELEKALGNFDLTL